MWKDFFYYTRNEQRGIVVLLVLVCVVIGLRILWPFLSLNQNITVEERDFLDKVKAINDSIAQNNEITHKDSLFLFNPNHVTESEMELLGFSPYQIKSFKGYRSKVGKIKSILDVQKVYGVDSVFLKKYTPFIQFDKEILLVDVPENPKDSICWVDFNVVDQYFLENNVSSSIIIDSIRSVLKVNRVLKRIPLYQVRKFSDEKLLNWIVMNSSPKPVKNEDVDLMDLNTADTLQLKKIKGIGSVLSKRIIKYRKLLGGYVKVEQLRQVYGISEDLYEKCNKYFYTDLSKVKQIKLRESNLKIISRHPYFNDDQSIELINLCRKGVDLRKIKASELRNTDEREWELMKLYLNLED